MTQSDREREILQSWIANSNPWIRTVQHGEIESRKLATNAAITEAVAALEPATVLDVGCGEGWLCRALESQGIAAYGVDGSPVLIEEALSTGSSKFLVQSYADIIVRGVVWSQMFDVIVCNFSLFGKDSTAPLLRALHPHLAVDGHMVIQTLHPSNPSIDATDVSGWRTESWEGMQGSYSAPYQWYYRTSRDWHALFRASGLIIEDVSEVLHPARNIPWSIIFKLTKE
jgi:2-polyprenyl-3-methyl-5-hydroxy-6-metoxy-1,4-benzoquinol methylase